MDLTPAQLDLLQRPPGAKIFLEGPAGCGKTTAAVERLLDLMAQGVPGGSILLLVPQRTLAAPYYEALRSPGVVAGGMVTVLTVGGLAQRMLDLYWPLVAASAGFAQPDRPPTFLTLESAQYYMAHLVRPLLDQGYFDTLAIDRNRLYSQILDNLNKAAVVGFPHTEIGPRLQSAWMGDPSQARVYADAQDCASRFRRYCLEHNLLDFSLQVEVFFTNLWLDPQVRDHLLGAYRHLIFDNLEEDTPVAHDLLRDWLPACDSALLVYDRDAGYRRFLGADPDSAYTLKDLCDAYLLFDKTFVSAPAVQELASGLSRLLSPAAQPPEQPPQPDPGEPPGLAYDFYRFYPQMLDWVAGQVQALVAGGVPPGEIAVLAPFLSDALRFSLTHRLQELGIPARSHRPSRSLRQEPVTQCLLTLASLAHPDWGYHPTGFDVAYALVQSIHGLDLVRARLLTDAVYQPHSRQALPDWEAIQPPPASPLGLLPFEAITPTVQERISYRFGELYDRLRLWLAEYAPGASAELDHFLSRLFGELLSQPGYAFHHQLAAGEITANLVESVQKFRWAAGEMLSAEGLPLGKEYLAMVQDGVIASQYIRSWDTQPEDAVLLAPAYTFLMSNRPLDYQFWLDAGSSGWFERLYQPLTHPYVLSRLWSSDHSWSADDEFRVAQDSLYRLALGLLRRCRKGLYLGLSELGEQGFEQRGPLLRAFQRMIREYAP